MYPLYSSQTLPPFSPFSPTFLYISYNLGGSDFSEVYIVSLVFFSLFEYFLSLFSLFSHFFLFVSVLVLVLVLVPVPVLVTVSDAVLGQVLVLELVLVGDLDQQLELHQ